MKNLKEISMKKILFICATWFLLLFTTGCDTIDTWPNGLPEMQNVFMIGFFKSNVNTDALNYEIAADGSARWRINTGMWTNTDEKNISSPIPLQLSSEQVRSFDVISYFWITNDGSSTLAAETDYSVTTENGTAIAPDGNEAYSVTWPQAKKGVQNVKIKRLSAKTGVLKVNVLNPANGTPSASDISTTVNNHTNDYEVRGMTFDYNKVTVTFN